MLTTNRYGIYQFRATVPSAIRSIVGKREIWRSLRTSNRAEAQKAEKLVSFQIEQVFLKIRELTQKKQTQSDVVVDIMGGFGYKQKRANNQLNNSDIMGSFSDIKHLFVDATSGTIKAEGVSVTSPEDAALLESLVSILSSGKGKEAATEAGKPIEGLLESYIAEKLKVKAWTEKTEAESRAHFKAFLDFKQERQLNTSLISEYKSHLLTLKNAHGEDLSASTINKYLIAVGGFTKWLFRNGHAAKNYCEGMLVTKRGAVPSEERSIFDNEDLKAIFAITDRETGARYWAPKLALYTGCRIEELCQLYVSDIREIDGIWCLDINADAEDKAIKTASAKRIIPLHDAIRDLFIAYVQSLDKGSRLFPELKLYRDGYSQSVSKWFGRMLRSKAKIDDKAKVFHSFRHTFSTGLKHALVPQEITEAMMGHKSDSMSYGRYGKAYPAGVLKNAIDQLKFDL